MAEKIVRSRARAYSRCGCKRCGWRSSYRRIVVRKEFGVGTAIALRRLHRHFCYRCFVYDHLPCDDFSLSLSLSLFLPLFLSLPSGKLTPLRSPQASYFARRFCLSVSLEFSHCRYGGDLRRCVSGKLTDWNNHFSEYIFSIFNDPK